MLITAAQQNDSVIHTFFFVFFSIKAYHRILDIAPCATQQGLVVYLCQVCFYISLNMNWLHDFFGPIEDGRNDVQILDLSSKGVF